MVALAGGKIEELPESNQKLNMALNNVQFTVLGFVHTLLDKKLKFLNESTREIVHWNQACFFVQFEGYVTKEYFQTIFSKKLKIIFFITGTRNKGL